MVNKVELELHADESELIRAANKPAIANPFQPVGRKPLIIAGSA